MSKMVSRRLRDVVFAGVLVFVVASVAHAQVFPDEEYLDVVRISDGSILKGRIIEDDPERFLRIEVYGGSIFTVAYENVLSVSQQRNPDYGKAYLKLRLGDFTEPAEQPEEQEEETPERLPVDTTDLFEVRYPSFSGGIGFYAPLELESGSDRMIDGGWSAGAVGVHIHSYDLIPISIGLEVYLSSQGDNGNYEAPDGTVTSTGDDSYYPYFDYSETQLVPSLLIGNHWQSVAVGATWLGIERERPLLMPTVQWRNLRVAASLADEGYLTAQYHLPIDARAKEARAQVGEIRESPAQIEYIVVNETWTRAFVRLNVGVLSSQPEIDYTAQSESGTEARQLAIRGPAGSGGAIGLELNRTLWNRLDLGVGVEFSPAQYSGNLGLEYTEEGWTDSYGYRDTIGGYLRVAGYATERFWGYGRFGMSITEVFHDQVEEMDFPKIPNHSFYPHWWTDLGIGVGFFRNRKYGLDLEAGPRFTILQTGDVTQNQDPRSIGVGIQASVRRNAAPVSPRHQAADRGLDPAARALGKPIWVRFAGGFRSNDQWVELDDPIDITDAGTEYQGVTDYSYWDTEFLGAAEAAVQLLPAHAVGLRFQTNLTNIYSFIDVNTDGEEYRHIEADIAIPYGMFIFHHLTWRALGLKTQAGLRIAHLRYPDDPVFRELYDDNRTFLHWGVAVGPTVRLFQFGDDDQHRIDLGITYRHEWIDLQAIFEETHSAPGFEVEIGYARRFGERQ